MRPPMAVNSAACSLWVRLYAIFITAAVSCRGAPQQTSSQSRQALQKMQGGTRQSLWMDLYVVSAALILSQP
jgi:hypothetical protein